MYISYVRNPIRFFNFLTTTQNTSPKKKKKMSKHYNASTMSLKEAMERTTKILADYVASGGDQTSSDSKRTKMNVEASQAPKHQGGWLNKLAAHPYGLARYPRDEVVNLFQFPSNEEGWGLDEGSQTLPDSDKWVFSSHGLSTLQCRSEGGLAAEALKKKVNVKIFFRGEGEPARLNVTTGGDVEVHVYACDRPSIVDEEWGYHQIFYPFREYAHQMMDEVLSLLLEKDCWRSHLLRLEEVNMCFYNVPQPRGLARFEEEKEKKFVKWSERGFLSGLAESLYSLFWTNVNGGENFKKKLNVAVITPCAPDLNQWLCSRLRDIPRDVPWTVKHWLQARVENVARMSQAEFDDGLFSVVDEQINQFWDHVLDAHPISGHRAVRKSLGVLREALESFNAWTGAWIIPLGKKPPRWRVSERVLKMVEKAFSRLNGMHVRSVRDDALRWERVRKRRSLLRAGVDDAFGEAEKAVIIVSVEVSKSKPGEEPVWKQELKDVSDPDAHVVISSKMVGMDHV